MKKKICIIMGIFLIIIIIAGIITKNLDSIRVSTGNEPKYCIKLINYHGNRVTYWGLGYKVIRYVGVSPNEPFKSNIGVKMGNWFMKYELPVEKDINNIDDFYNTELTKNMDIRYLEKEYDFEDAQNDNCFVIGNGFYNIESYNEFMKKYKNKEDAFIRVVTSTVEGDAIIIDLLYEANNNKIHLVKDSTRDEFASAKDRIVKYKTYEKTGVWKYQNYEYWVVYNKELPEGEKSQYTLDSDEIYIITRII